jgi:ABC-type phosphate transport system substrate-binding protein
MPRFSNWMLGLLVGLALLAPARRASAQSFVVVANETGPASLSKDELSRAFLKKSTHLAAVDQDKESKVRGAFSRAILGRPVTAVASYWQQQIFSGGDAPPAEKASDADVLAYVRANPKAIGYVATGTDLGTGVHALVIQ